MLDLTPLELFDNYFSWFGPDSLQKGEVYTFEVELMQLEDDTFLLKASEDFKAIKDMIDTLNCTSIAKERLTNKLKEETFPFLLASRYFNSVVYHLKVHNLPNALQVPLTTTSRTQCAGLLMTPDEMNVILGGNSFTYTPYLTAVLDFTEMLVDYTTNIIIKVSTDPNGDDSIKSQYSLALLNLSLLSHLQNGFQMLDLKNDGLRRKYDKLKYNLKKMNGIVYDLSLRNLFIFRLEILD